MTFAYPVHRLALLGKARRLVDGVLEDGVAPAAAAAARHNRLLAVLDQIDEQLVGVAQIDRSAWRHEHDFVFAASSLLVVAFAVAPTIGAEMNLKLKWQERVHVLVDAQDHAAAIAAVAAVWPAARDVFLAPKGDDAVAAATAIHIDSRFVKKEIFFCCHCA